MRPLYGTVGAALSAGLVLAWLGGGSLSGQQVLQHDFEARDPIWVRGQADAAFKETAHRLTDETAHTGHRSEHIQLQAEQGTFIHYTCDVGRAPVTDELNVSLWLKANRPGMQLRCRVVLPRERDPRSADQPLTLLIAGDTYKLVGRWQQLTLPQPVKRLREQQQLLQAADRGRGRDLVTAGAYVDRLELNVYGGPGPTDVWTDDLEVGPVLDARPPAAPDQVQGPARARPAVNRRAAEVQLRGNQLLVSGKPFFLRGIRHTGTPLRVLRDAGFNTVWLDESTPAGLIEDAAGLGFWIVPTITPPGLTPRSGGVEAQLTSREAFGRTVARFLDQDAVLCWDLGSNLASERFPDVARTAEAFRAADPMRPVAADVWDGFQRYSRSVDQLLLGVHRWPLLTALELNGYRDWLTQRRRLAPPETFCWTWVQTHLPDWFLALAYDNGGAGNFTEPVGPQAEQVRLMAYTAVGSGYRGLGFWSDRFLADSHTGRDRLLALAALNQEFEMLEPLLVGGKEPEWIDTSHAAVKAAVIRTGRAVLVLPVWIGAGAQFVPGQDAAAEVTLVVPQVPATTQAWEVTPGRVRSFPSQRVIGGTQVKLHDFSMTAAIVFTADLGPTGLVVRFQDQQRRMSRVAAQWANDQAREELTKVEQVHAALEKLGHTLPDGTQLLEKARDALNKGLEHRRNGQHAEAYSDAQTALRALRSYMRAHWDRAVKYLDSPVASPYAVSFYTLPRHWQMWEQMRQSRPAANVLPDGDFEAPPERVPPGWLVQEVPSLDPVVPVARRVTEKPHEGRQCLMLQINAKDPLLPPLALERTFLALHSPAVRLRPGTLVRVSAWVRIPVGVGSTSDGALFYDSVGGEPLAVRLTGRTDWKKYTLYRRVPASGTINVTLALTGLGTVYFDDVRIEPLVGRPAESSDQSTAPGTPRAPASYAQTRSNPPDTRGGVPPAPSPR
jgi:hypothetical protein